MVGFRRAFRGLDDPRAINCQHDLLEVLFIALAALLCGAEGAVDMERFGYAKEAVLRTFLRLDHGIPSHDTFSRIFRILDPIAFEKAFHKFVRAFARASKIDLQGVIAIDGKSLRGAFDRGRRATPLHLVNAFAAEARLALASHKAPDRNEVAGALEVLRMLQLKGNVVTADALFCIRPVAELIIKRGGNYVLALKGNQSSLFRSVKQRFEHKSGLCSTDVRLESKSHGRREKRTATVIVDQKLATGPDFPGLAAFGRILAERRTKGGKTQKTVRYYLLSLPLPADEFLRIARSRWSVENQLHWLLDVVMREDANRARKDHSGENLAILRKLALNLLRLHPAKFSLRLKSKTAGWDDTFLLSLIGQIAHMR
jgi:predicted transposase YbfD/YdcC